MVRISHTKQLQQSINYLYEDDAKEGAKGDVQAHEGFPPEIHAIPPVDNLITPVFVPFEHITNVNAVLIVQLFFLLQILFILVLQLSD